MIGKKLRKNLRKAITLCLASAMVIGITPVTNVEAATTPKLTNVQKQSYVSQLWNELYKADALVSEATDYTLYDINDDGYKEMILIGTVGGSYPCMEIYSADPYSGRVSHTSLGGTLTGVSSKGIKAHFVFTDTPSKLGEEDTVYSIKSVNNEMYLYEELNKFKSAKTGKTKYTTDDGLTKISKSKYTKEYKKYNFKTPKVYKCNSREELLKQFKTNVTLNKLKDGTYRSVNDGDKVRFKQPESEDDISVCNCYKAEIKGNSLIIYGRLGSVDNTKIKYKPAIYKIPLVKNFTVKYSDGTHTEDATTKYFNGLLGSPENSDIGMEIVVKNKKITTLTIIDTNRN